MWTILFGLYFLALGGILALHNLGVFSLRGNDGWGIAWALLFVVLGVGILTRRRRHTPEKERTHGFGVGDIRLGEEPFNLGDKPYEMGVGRLSVDLTAVAIPSGETAVRARVGVGSLQMRLPPDLAVDVEAAAGMGAVNILGQKSEGFGREMHVTSPDYAQAERRVRLDLDVGIGEIVVRRAGQTPAL